MSPQRPEPGAAERQQYERLSKDQAIDQLTRGQAEPPPPADPSLRGEYAVQEVHHDYLVCKLVVNGATYGGSVNIAKCPGVRKSIYHGRTLDGLYYDYTDVQARTVTKSTATPPAEPNPDDPSKDQVIIPKYLVPSDETAPPTGELAFTGSVITVDTELTLVENDAGSPLWCQLVETTQRAYANDEGSS